MSNGFDNQFGSTQLSVTATLQATGGQPVPLRMQARRRADLHWKTHLDRARALSRDYAAATELVGDECDLLLLGASYTPQRASDFGLWTPLVRQCSAQRARSGMARYQLGQSILGVAPRGEALTLSSDGTRDYGLRSAAFGEDGQPVRRFAIVDKCIAAGQSVDHREAALGGITANGGVRNLVVAGGRRSVHALLVPGTRPLLIVDRLSEVHAEDGGAICLQIDRGRWRRSSSAGTGASAGAEQFVLGGVVSGNLYHWLADAHYSSETEDYLWYQGPTAIRFNGLRVHG